MVLGEIIEKSDKNEFVQVRVGSIPHDNVQNRRKYAKVLHQSSSTQLSLSAVNTGLSDIMIVSIVIGVKLH